MAFTIYAAFYEATYARRDELSLDKILDFVLYLVLPIHTIFICTDQGIACEGLLPLADH